MQCDHWRCRKEAQSRIEWHEKNERQIHVGNYCDDHARSVINNLNAKGAIITADDSI